MSSRLPTARDKWHQKLDKGDIFELLKWVEQSGLERVARIVALLNDASGERGRPEKPDSLLLLKIAHLKQQQPNRTLHSIALEVAGETHRDRRPLISKASLVSKLERDSKRHRHTWTRLASRTPPPSPEEISRDARRPQSSNAFRALARIIEVMPSAIDLYDDLLADANKLGPDKARLVRLVGREQVEAMLAEALKGQATSSFVVGAQGARKIPRNYFDLIEPDLLRFRKNREQAAAQRRRVGRKPAQ